MCYRSDGGDGTDTDYWPSNKVVKMPTRAPIAVEGKSIHFAATEADFEDEWVALDDVVETIEDIDTVVFCTGYKYTDAMLDADLRTNPETEPLKLPEDWKMPKSTFSERLGHVKPAEEGWYYEDITEPEVYQGLLIRNPK